MTKRLYKSNNKVISGVCAGIAEYFNIDPTLVRLALVVFSFFSGGIGGLIAYIIAAIVIPAAPVDGGWNQDSWNNPNQGSGPLQ